MLDHCCRASEGQGQWCCTQTAASSQTQRGPRGRLRSLRRRRRRGRRREESPAHRVTASWATTRRAVGLPPDCGLRYGHQGGWRSRGTDSTASCYHHHPETQKEPVRQWRVGQKKSAPKKYKISLKSFEWDGLCIHTTPNCLINASSTDTWKVKQMEQHTELHACMVDNNFQMDFPEVITTMITAHINFCKNPTQDGTEVLHTLYTIIHQMFLWVNSTQSQICFIVDYTVWMLI